MLQRVIRACLVETSSQVMSIAQQVVQLLSACPRNAPCWPDDRRSGLVSLNNIGRYTPSPGTQCVHTPGSGSLGPGCPDSPRLSGVARRCGSYNASCLFPLHLNSEAHEGRMWAPGYEIMGAGMRIRGRPLFRSRDPEQKKNGPAKISGASGQFSSGQFGGRNFLAEERRERIMIDTGAADA